MPYWVYENGKTIGPLRFEDVINRARPDSLVSHEQGWLPFCRHPDFARSDEQLSVIDEPPVGNVESKPATIGGPPQKRGAVKRAILGCLVILSIGAVALIVVVGKVANRGGDESHEIGAEQELRGESSEVVWAYSEPIDTVMLETQFRADDAGTSAEREILEAQVKEGGIARISGGDAWVASSWWQALDRSRQKSMLESLAIVGCGCLDPNQWNAAIRSVESNEILATFSPNRLRVLWTKAGVFPAPAGDPDSVDTTSGMTRSERFEALMGALSHAETPLRGTYDVEGTFYNRVEHELMGQRIDLIGIRNATASRSYSWDSAPASLPNRLIFIMVDPEVQTHYTEGESYAGTHWLTPGESSGVPYFFWGATSESRRRRELERERLLGEIRTALAAQSDQELEIGLRSAQDGLRPLRDQYRQLDGSLTRFKVSGQIVDQLELWIQVYGYAIPSDGNWDHAGSVTPPTPQSLAINQPGGSPDPIFFSRDGLFFLGIGPGGFRKYSSTPPDDAQPIVSKLDGLSSAMIPLKERVDLIQEELRRRRATLDAPDPTALARSAQSDLDSDYSADDPTPFPHGRSTAAAGSKAAPNRTSAPSEAESRSGAEGHAIPRPTKPTDLTTDAKGNTYLPGGQSARQQIPSWVPVYSNGRFQNPSYMGMGNALIGGFEVVTSDPANAVVEFYRSSLRNSGFNVDGDSAPSAGGDGRRINAYDKSKSRTVEVTVAHEGDTTTVTVSYKQAR